MSSRPCLETLPCNILQTQSAGHFLDALASRILQLQLLCAKWQQWELILEIPTVLKKPMTQKLHLGL